MSLNLKICSQICGDRNEERGFIAMKINGWKQFHKGKMLSLNDFWY